MQTLFKQYLFIFFSLLAFTPQISADETIPNETDNLPIVTCDTFADAVQTRSDDSTVDFSGGSAKIYNNPDTTLNTYNTPTNGGEGNDLTCVDNINGDTDQSCQSNNRGATAIAPITMLYPATFTFPENDTSGGDSIVVGKKDWGDNFNSGDELDENVYNSVTAHGGVSPNHLNFKITNQLKLGTLQAANGNQITFTSTTDNDFEIIATTINTNPSIVFTADTLVKNVKIKRANFGDTNTVNITAEQTIKIDSFSSQHTSDYNLTAPYVNINTLTDVSGSDKENTITIKADYVDIGTLNLGDATTLTITPLTPNKDVLVKINSLSTGSNNILNFTKGTYYVKHLDTSGSGSGYQWNMNGKVNLILEDDWNSDSAIAINADHTGGGDLSTDSHSAADLFLYSKGNITTVNNTRIVGTIYSEKNITLNSASYIKGALSAQDLITLKNATQVYYDPIITGEGMGKCPTPIPYLTGPFDAWDTFRDHNVTPPSDKNISTKVVNEAFKLSLASLNKSSNGYEVKASAGSSIDIAIYPKNSTVAISNHITYNANTYAHIPSSADFNVTSAQKDAVVGFKLCATYENDTSLNDTIYILHPVSECSGPINACDATTTGSPTWHVCNSTDNFAIRPYAFRVFGENQYKYAGEDFNITIKAVDKTNFNKNSGSASSVQATPDFNVSTNTLNFSSNFYIPSNEDREQMQADTGITDVTTCPNNGTFSVIDNNFSNGDVNVSMNFSETGILDINASEKLGSEFALVDADDTQDSQRLIQSTSTIYDTTDISQVNLFLFVPYTLVTTADYNTTTAKSWLYMNDINGSTTTPAMSSYISYTITAQNKSGATTKNFTKTCFPDTVNTAPTINDLKLNTTFDLFLDATINSSSDANLSLYSEDNNSIAIWTMNTNKVIVKGNNNLQEWISPLNFTNGVGKAKVHFNIDRNNSVSLNPVAITVIDVNTSTAWMSNPGSPKNFTGATLNKSFNYIYGRTNAPRQRFVGNTGTAFIYYQGYCSGTDVNNNTCDKSLLPDGTSSVSNDDPRWFNNPLHNSSTDGIAGTAATIIQKNGQTDVTTTSLSTHNPESARLQYHGSDYPYKTTMTNKPSPWLIYNKYKSDTNTTEFEVEFTNNNSQWAGQHETNTSTTKNASDMTNRRSMW